MTAVKSDALKIVPVARLVSLWRKKIMVRAPGDRAIASGP